MRPSPMSATEAATVLGLAPAETASLSLYLELLSKWQRRINLVGRTTLDDPWRRHILDCGQLRRHLPESVGRIADLGSGAGLPGLVLSVLGVRDVDLIESDARKAAFLTEARRALSASARIVRRRAEALPSGGYDVIVCRALAPLPRLLPLAHYLLATSGKLLILKGRTMDEELTQGRIDWTLSAETHQSLSDPEGVVLMISDIEPRDD